MEKTEPLPNAKRKKTEAGPCAGLHAPLPPSLPKSEIKQTLLAPAKLDKEQMVTQTSTQEHIDKQAALLTAINTSQSTTAEHKPAILVHPDAVSTGSANLPKPISSKQPSRKRKNALTNNTNLDLWLKKV